MTSPKKCGSGGDVFLVIYLVCTFVANGYCDNNNFNKNYKEALKPRVFNTRSTSGITEINRNLKENQIKLAHLNSVGQQSFIKTTNYTSNTTDEWHNIECRCNTTKLSSESTSIVDCHICVNSENENSVQDVENDKLFKLNYSQNEVNETIYLNVNFENLTHTRQRRDVIDESSTSTNGLHGKWY